MHVNGSAAWLCPTGQNQHREQTLACHITMHFISIIFYFAFKENAIQCNEMTHSLICEARAQSHFVCMDFPAFVYPCNKIFNIYSFFMDNTQFKQGNKSYAHRKESQHHTQTLCMHLALKCALIRGANNGIFDPMENSDSPRNQRQTKMAMQYKIMNFFASRVPCQCCKTKYDEQWT